VLEIPPGKKPAYHTAAVISSNFPVVLASVAGHLLHDWIPDASAYSGRESDERSAREHEAALPTMR